MSAGDDSRVEELLGRAAAGEAAAVEELLSLFRDRLCRMARVRLDPALAPRVDPSDVVQEALADAVTKLPAYLRGRPLPFYPWLRHLAWERLLDLTRRHVAAQKRNVYREAVRGLGLPDPSAALLAERVLAVGPSPSGPAQREELRQRVRDALDRLPSREREVLVLRYLEQLSNPEVAAVLGVSERTVKGDHRRALEAMQRLLGGPPGEEP